MVSEDGDTDRVPRSQTDASPPSEPTIKLTSLEGSKGLQAQHVFVVGMHDGDLPRSAGEIKDLESVDLSWVSLVRGWNAH
jgi:superfamily I DNA/RNA helicase